MLDQTAQFLPAAEADAVDAALLSSSEKFLVRLTLSTRNLLHLIAQDLAVDLDELTPAQIIAWFERDAKVKREQGVEASVLKWHG